MIEKQIMETQTPPPKVSRVDDILVGIATGNKELINPKPKIEELKDDSDEKSLKPDDKSIKPDIKYKKKPIDQAPNHPDEQTPMPAAAEKKEPKELKETSDSKEPKDNNYGIPEDAIQKEEPKYTDSDVNKMIRERLDRMKQPASSAQVEAIAKEMKSDPNDQNAWKQEFVEIVKEVNREESQKAERQRMEQEEIKTQSEFERKMDDGGNKYKDFWQVLNTAPITPTIMIGAREMDDPASFLYAASKLYPEELGKISKMDNPAALMIQLGKLEERMKRNAKNTAAPRPLTAMRGDFHGEEAPPKQEPTIDQRIQEHAKQRKGVR